MTDTQQQVAQLLRCLDAAERASARLVCDTKMRHCFPEPEDDRKDAEAKFQAARTAHGHVLDTKERVKRALAHLRNT